MRKDMLLCMVLLMGLGSFAWADYGCIAPDLGGTTLVPPSCPHDDPADNMRIIDGLPPGDTVEFIGPLDNIAVIDSFPGGNLGGEVTIFDATYEWQLEGTGQLAGYTRSLTLVVSGEVHTGPRNPGDPVQTFPTEMFNLQGEIFGDPDFDYLALRIGSANGLPQSMGDTTLTQLPSGDFAVDSFFDITYQIEFQGAIGGPLEGLAGTTTGPVRPATPPSIPTQVDTHFVLMTENDWLEALSPPPGASQVRPMLLPEWEDYMAQYNDIANLDGHEPYPPTEFLEAGLYVWPEPTPEVPDGAGLVMHWGDKDMPQGPYASAWIYQYGVDPDLSNSTVTIQVEAPCGIQQISVGLQDNNGLRRGWYWNVAPSGAPGGPGLLTCSPDALGNPVRHTIKIDLSQTGTTAATPMAFSYSSTLGFSIQNVLNFVFDENFAWVPGVTNVPPPGQTDPNPWNYWFNLTVTPNNATVNKGYHVKWSQPPVELAEGLINGWDEVSLYEFGPPIMADDWACDDERPVTDIHWWGSFLGWNERSLPTIAPYAFHIGIWTDVPVDPADPESFSHPGVMIWENYCTSWAWNFAGYDIDPRPDGQVDEACFQFNQLLSEPEWFDQHPMADGTPNIYWLSIAAIYPPGIEQGEILHPWGWKTRPHHFNDDAVRIFNPVMPTPGTAWVQGMPVEFPDGVSWDLAFELTTNQPDPDPESRNPDLDRSGFVDYVDFAILSAQWMTFQPITP